MNRNKSVIVQIYAQLLREESLDPMVQRAILRYATAGKLVDLLTALAGRLDIDPEVDAALGRCDIGKVRVAWMGHPRRDREVAREALRKEKRTGVLSVLAATPELSEEDYRVLAETGQHKVCHELILNPDVSDAVKQIAAAGWGASIPGGTKYKSKEAMELIVGSYPELVPALLSQINTVALLSPPLESALNNGVSIPSAIAIRAAGMIEREAVRLGAEASSYGRWYAGRELSAALKCLRQLLGNPGIDQALVGAVNEIHDRLRIAKGFEKQEWITQLDLLECDLAIAAGAVAQGSLNTLPPAAQARVVEDPEQLRAFAAAAALNSDVAMAASLMANPASPADVLERVIGHYDRAACARLVQARAEEIELLTVVVSKYPHLINDELLARSGDPEGVLIQVLSKHTYSSFLARELWESNYLSERVIEHVPLRAVGHGLEYAAARGRIQRMLINRLGESGEHWGLLESLSESFEGTFGQLLLVGESTLGKVSFQPTPAARGEELVEDVESSDELGESAETDEDSSTVERVSLPPAQTPAVAETADSSADVACKTKSSTGRARGARSAIPSNALQGLLFEMV